MSNPAGRSRSPARYSLQTLLLGVTACGVLLGSFRWLPPNVIVPIILIGGLAAVLLLGFAAVRIFETPELDLRSSTQPENWLVKFGSRVFWGIVCAGICGLAGFLLPIVSYFAWSGFISPPGGQNWNWIVGWHLALMGVRAGVVSGLLIGFATSKRVSIQRSLFGLSCVQFLQAVHFVFIFRPHAPHLYVLMIVPSACMSLVLATLAAIINANRALKQIAVGPESDAVKSEPPAIPSAVPATIQAVVGLVCLLPLILAIRKLLYYWDMSPYPVWGNTDIIPTLTLAVFFLLHADGLRRRQDWAKFVAWTIALVAVGAWLTGLWFACPIFAGSSQGNGYAGIATMVILVWLGLGLVPVGVFWFVAALTLHWKTEPASSESHSKAILWRGIVSVLLLALAPAIDVSLWQAQGHWKRMHQQRPYLDAQRKKDEQLKQAQELTDRWVAAFDRGDRVAISQAEAALERHLRIESGALVTVIRFRAKNGPYARRMGLLGLLARPTFAIRSSSAIEHDHQQVGEQAFAILVDETNVDEIRQLAFAIIWNQKWNKYDFSNRRLIEDTYKRLKRLDPIALELERLATDVDSPPEKRRDALLWLELLAPRHARAREIFERLSEQPASQQN